VTPKQIEALEAARRTLAAPGALRFIMGDGEQRISVGEMVNALDEALKLAEYGPASPSELLTNIVMNAVIQPDASMGGQADCYAVPLDDIEAAREELRRLREKKPAPPHTGREGT
jgi:hypothetical protein